MPPLTYYIVLCPGCGEADEYTRKADALRRTRWLASQYKTDKAGSLCTTCGRRDGHYAR